MADTVSSAPVPVFQPRPGIQGLATAYLTACLSERVTVADSGCWECLGDGERSAYAVLDLKRWPEWPESIVPLHRLSYRLCVGPIPEGMCVLHRCDNPPCINPAHLFLGTNLDNISDKVQKRRQASGQKVRKNHGHLKGEVVVTSRLTAEQVMEIRRREHAGEKNASLAEEFGISETHLQYIVRGKAWAHLPVFSRESRSVRTCPKCGAVVVTMLGKFNKHVAECHSKE